MMTRRRVLEGAGGLAAWALMAACEGSLLQGSYRRYRLADLTLDDGGGRPTRYAEAIDGLPEVSGFDRRLPFGRIFVGALPGTLRWLAAYDFDANQTIDSGELTQAWLVRAAELATGRAYAPDALKAFLRPEQPSALAGAVALRGLDVGRDDERVVRKVLDRTAAGAALTEAVTKQFTPFWRGDGSGGM